MENKSETKNNNLEAFCAHCSKWPKVSSLSVQKKGLVFHGYYGHMNKN